MNSISTQPRLHRNQDCELEYPSQAQRSREGGGTGATGADGAMGLILTRTLGSGPLRETRLEYGNPAALRLANRVFLAFDL